MTSPRTKTRSHWKIRQRELTLEKPLIMGILNLTPDSFSDGGIYLAPEAAIARAQEMEKQGAHLIDLGAESTRPASQPVDPRAEWERLAPVLKILAKECPLPLSVDTRHGEVAEAAIEAGAAIINDVSGGADSRLNQAVAQGEVGYVLMHSRGVPQTMMEQAQYTDLMTEIATEWGISLKKILGAGISPEQVVLDPGFGFAKEPSHNYQLLTQLGQLTELGYPIMVGLSRKRFLREILGEEVEALDRGTAVANLLAYQQGARIFRVHEVAGCRRTLEAFLQLTNELGEAGNKGMLR